MYYAVKKGHVNTKEEADEIIKSCIDLISTQQ